MTIPAILSTYRLQLFQIPLWDIAGLTSWLEDVSFWLARVNDRDFERWSLVMAGALSMKTGRPLKECLGVVQGEVVRLLAKEVKR